MLGEQISEGKGKRTARRVTATEPSFQVEVSFEEAAKLLGVDGMNIGTYVSGPKADGSLHGEGRGVYATMDGDIVTWTGAGAGKLGPSGAVSYRGAIHFNTAAPKFTRLNSVAGVFEFDVDAAGNTQSKIWEWR